MRVRPVAAALAGLALCFACSPSPTPAPSSPAGASSAVSPSSASSASAPATASASASATVSANAPGACAKDADCTLASDYCGGCFCRSLGPGAGPPACPGKPVQCLVDPCLRKVAACEGGRCVERAGGAK